MASLVRNLVAGMSARERRMLVAMAVALLTFGMFLAVFFVNSSIGELEEANEEREQLLRFIELKEPEYVQKKRDRDSSSDRSGVKPTPLRTLVDGVVKKIGISDPDTKELTDQHHGDRWVEHGVELSLRQVGLENLTKFMEEVEGNRKKFPIAITKLEIRKRKVQMDQFDVKMTISTYEMTEAEASSASHKGGKLPRKGGR